MTNEELNRIVAEKVMGCCVKQDEKGRYDLVVPGGVNQIGYVLEAGAWSGVPEYSTDIRDAMEVVEKITSIHKVVRIERRCGGKWGVIICDGFDSTNCSHLTDEWDGPDGFEEWDKFLPRAICLAALRAKGVDIA